jgi:HK97 family phage prohead protease
MTVEYRYLKRSAPNVADGGKIHGRAWPYNSWTQIGKGPYGFREKVNPGAGTKSINDGDIVLLDNHESRLPLARMSAGTLEMRDGAAGGDWEATLANTTYARDVAENVRAGNYGGCSFGFEVIRDKWMDDEGNPASPLDGTQREILEMKVHEISVCTFPAYGDTMVSPRDQALAARGALDEREDRAGKMLQKVGTNKDDTDGPSDTKEDDPAEGDSSDGTGKKKAKKKLKSVPANPSDAGRSGWNDDDFETEDERDAQKPYGDVAYADPGYQKDGKKRYPIDTKKHAKAAWAYINKAKNAAAYSAQQVASIKSKIKAALAKFGVKADSETNMEAWEALCDFREMTEGFEEREYEDMVSGVYPANIVRIRDANYLATEIKAAATREARVNAIQLATDLGLPDLLPPHWSSNGDIGAGAIDDAQRDMAAIYELAVNLPATRDALDILNLAEPYLSTDTIRSAQKKAEEEERQDAEGRPEPLTLERMKAIQQEARDRLSSLG